MTVEAPVNEDAVRKAFATSFKEAGPSEDIARHVLASAGLSPDEIAKNIAGPSLNLGSGLVAFDLQAPAKNLYPVYCPIRNALPRVGGGTGTGTNWRQVNSIAGSGWDAMGWVPEGQRAGPMTYNTSNKFAGYVTLGEEANITFEAINASRTFEDLQATMGVRLLQKMFLKEEMALMFGNTSLQLGTPATPTVSAAGSGATLPAATYSVIVVALSGEGYNNASRSAPLSVPLTKNITGLDGQTFTLNGGSSAKSAAASTGAVTLGQTVSASTPAIQGALAYAWFVGVAGSETLQAITTINSASFSAPLSTGNQAATAITAATDLSTNSTAFNGLFTSACLPGSGANVTYLPTGVSGVGNVLTASGRGSVNEIDAMMLNMWNKFQLSLDVLYVNAQELQNITNKVLTGTSGSLMHYFQDPKEGEYKLTAGGTVEFYYNPFMAPGAGRKIPIRIHPNLAPGTILGWTNNLPIQYQNDHVGNIAEVKTRQDYYQIAWPLISRQRQSGVYTEEVLAIYAPFGLGVLSNIANG